MKTTALVAAARQLSASTGSVRVPSALLRRDGAAVMIQQGRKEAELLVSNLPQAQRAALNSMGATGVAELEGQWVRVGKKIKRDAFDASSVKLETRPAFVPKGSRPDVLRQAAVVRDGATLRLGAGPQAPELLLTELVGRDIAQMNAIASNATVDLTGVWVQVGKKIKREAFLAKSVVVH